MPTATVTYSLSCTDPVTGRLSGTYMTALEYPVSETERAESEWSAKRDQYIMSHPDAIDVQIYRSAPFEKPSFAEHVEQIDRVQREQLAGLGYGNTWDD